MDATWVIPAFVVMDTLVERLGQRTPRTPPACGGTEDARRAAACAPNPRVRGGGTGGVRRSPTSRF